MVGVSFDAAAANVEVAELATSSKAKKILARIFVCIAGPWPGGGGDAGLEKGEEVKRKVRKGQERERCLREEADV